MICMNLPGEKMYDRELIEQIEKTAFACYSSDAAGIKSDMNILTGMIMKKEVLAVVMLPVLEYVIAAMEREDYILVADYLIYGMIPLLKEEKTSYAIDYRKLDWFPSVAEDVFYMASFSSEPVLCVKKSGSENNMDVYYRLNSSVNPEFEACMNFKSVLDNDQVKTICLFGLGTGILAHKILKDTQCERLIIYEPDKKVLDYCLNSVDDGAEKKVSDRIKGILTDERTRLFLEGGGENGFSKILYDNIDYSKLKGMKVLIHGGYDRAYSESCIRFYREINANRERILVNLNTLSRFRKELVVNPFRNLHILRNANLVSELAGGKIIPQDIPAIIISAGPSLDKNIDVLKNAKGHCLLFCTDTAIKYMLNKDIIPDLIISIDPAKDPANFLDDRIQFIPAIFDIESNPEIVERHKGKIFLFNCRGYIKNLFEKLGKACPEEIPSGGSVATAAFSVLRFLGMKKIVFVGQDLAYSGQSTHAGGVESIGVNNKIGYEIVEDIYGGKIRTRIDWLGYLRWFEKAIEDIKSSRRDTVIIDATEGGAKIQGTEILSLEETISGFKDDTGKMPLYDFTGSIEIMSPFLEKTEFKKLLDLHRDSIYELEKIKNAAKKGIELCSLNLVRSGAENIEAEISEICHICENALLYPMINNYAVCGIREKPDNEITEENERMNGQLKSKKEAFEGIVEACDFILESARNTEKILSD